MSNFLSDFLDLETEESKGGEGGDSGECGPLPEDREGSGQGPVRGADLRPPAQLQRRHEVLSAEG